MSESTLNLKLADLESKVGQFLGFGRGANESETSWSTAQQNIITDCIESGLSQFYKPPAVETYGAYEWTFLTPVTELGLASGTRVVQLPDDFNSIDGPITVSSEGGRFQELRLTGDVRRMFAEQPEAAGPPQFAELEPVRGGTQNESTRWELRIYPEADTDYTLTLRYSILPDMLTSGQPYVLGGATHRETIIESCLAIAEERYHDKPGVHNGKFLERLRASILFDQRLRPHHLGRNSDWTTIPQRRSQMDRVITIGGLTPS